MGRRMNCVILGGGGFIGSHVAQLLHEKGMKIFIFDRPNIETHGISDAGSYVWLEGDCCNRSDVRAALRNKDYVVHLVSTTMPKTSNANPSYDIETNLAGAIIVLECMKEERVGKIVFASSGGTVYGNPVETPIPETHPTDPICSHGICKLAIEKYIHMYHALHGISYVVLRMSNAYGERQRSTVELGAINVFLSRVLNRAPIEIWGDGEVVRDYVYVRDIADAFARALERKECSRRVLNIGSGTGLSLNEIVRKVEAVTGLEADVRYTESRVFDVRKNVLDVRKAFRELGWKPETPIDRGIRNMYDWYRRE
jgi:UDP-glucose 4-epimerase